MPRPDEEVGMVGEQGPGVALGPGRDSDGPQVSHEGRAVQSAADEVMQGPWGILAPGAASAVSRSLPKDAPSPSGIPPPRQPHPSLQELLEARRCAVEREDLPRPQRNGRVPCSTKGGRP